MTWPTYLLPVLIYKYTLQVGIVEEKARFDVNRRLSMAFVAEKKLRIEDAPEIRTW